MGYKERKELINKVKELPYEHKDLRTTEALCSLIDNILYIPVEEIEKLVQKFGKI